MGLTIFALSYGIASLTTAEDLVTGFQSSVGVTRDTRIDWVYVLANQSPRTVPADWLIDYDSKKQTYQLYVPRNYDPKKSYPLVLFVSPSDKATGFRNWQRVCEEQQIVFAGPHDAGNNCEIRRRVRIILDVLDDVRRTYNVDTNRSYIGGFSGGGRIACSIAFALPEYFGGVMPICAAGDLREESWLRHRVIDRLSVAHVTGESDFNRGEVERFRGPMLADVGVRSRVWVVPKTGHTIPDVRALCEAFRWLEAAAPQRRTLAEQYPSSCLSHGEAVSRDDNARRLFEEAQLRVAKDATRYSGLMQLKGILTRWPDLPQADAAKKILLEHESADIRKWEEDDIAEQRRFLFARAKGLDAYASGPLPKQYENQRSDMASAAIQLWQVVIDDGQDPEMAAHARQRVPKLRELLNQDSR